jgi:GNAT superfamily N-acetyltransferase
MPVRKFAARTDMPRLRQCLIELQDFERNFDPRLPSGEEIVDAYIPDMLKRCRDCDGTILIAEVEGLVAGYVTVLAKVSSDEVGAGDFEFGLVTDIVVLPEYRKTGLGKELLRAAEAFARAHGVKWLRIGALEANQAARDMYSMMGFSGLYVELEKDLTESK